METAKIFCLPLIAFACLLLTADAGLAQEHDEYRKSVREALRTLETRYTDFRGPKDNPLEDRVREAKRLVKGMLKDIQDAKSDEEATPLAQIFSDECAASMSKSPTFRLYDYYLLWLGARVFIAVPPRDKEFQLRLVEKIDNRGQVPGDGEVRDEISAFAVELLTEITKWDGPRVIEKENRLNEANWKLLKEHVLRGAKASK